MELIYTKDNTYPPIEAILRKAATGEVIDLSGATVTIEVKDTSDTVQNFMLLPLVVAQLTFQMMSISEF